MTYCLLRDFVAGSGDVHGAQIRLLYAPIATPGSLPSKALATIFENL